MRVKRSLKNIFTGLISQIFVLIFSFVTRTIFIHYLGKEYLGLNSVFSNILNTLSIIELGVGQAITLKLYRALAKDNKEEISALINLYKKLYSYIALIIVVIALAIIPFLKYLVKGNLNVTNLTLVYILFIISSIIPYFYSYKSTLIISDEKNYIVSQINAIIVILINIFQIVFLILTKSYIYYLLISIVFLILQNIYISQKVNKLYPYLKEHKKAVLNKNDKDELISHTKTLTLYKFGTISLNYTDNIIISIFVGLGTVAMYSNYTLLITSVSSILSTIFQSVVASIGNLNTSNDKEKKILIFDVVNLASFLFYGGCTVCLVVLINPFISLWIGTNYLLDSKTMIIIMISFYIGGMLFAPVNFRQTMGLFVYGKYRPIISAVLNLIISIILAKRIGIAGVLLGTIITRALTNLWYDPYLIYKKEFNISLLIYFKKYILYGIVTIISAVASSFISLSLGTSNIILLIVNAFVCITVFLVIAIAVFFRTNEMKYLIMILKNLLKKRIIT